MASFHCLTFMTDYGLEDAFVAVCHGVSSRIAPDIRIIDITHLVPPGDIRRGAAVLAQAVPYFPPAVHVAVVDPGVGTARRAIAVAAGGSVFVGPDNGLLSWAVEAAGGATAAVSLTNRALWLDAGRLYGGARGGRPPGRGTVTATFHGRDIFMPVAAHLAAGAATLAQAGDHIAVGSLVVLPRPVSRVGEGTAEGEVVTVDRFGNVQLSVTGADAARAGIVPGARVALGWRGRELTMPFGTTFAEVAPGELVSYPDSAGFVAIAVNGGDAARSLALLPGTRVTLSARELFIRQRSV